MAQLAADFYGKGNVRVTKVVRTGSLHTLYEFNVRILLTGDFTRCYTEGDNSMVIPTDTMKNTVYALAAQHDFTSPEQFGRLLTKHFINQFAHVIAATAEISQTRWERIAVGAQAHQHAFQLAGSGERTARIVSRRDEPSSDEGGISGLQVLKTTRSGFVNFIRDQYTTLPDVSDRIFATTVNANWQYLPETVDFNGVYDAAVRLILDVFAEHDSLAVQQTIFAMGEQLLAKIPALESVSLTMPNQHRIPVNLEPLGLTNTNSIFVTTSEPYGLIHGTITRD